MASLIKEYLALTRLFASLAFDQDDVEIQEWITRRFAMLRDILRDTYIHKYDVAEAREEERQVHLQSQRKLLLAIVEAHFPTLISIAKTQAEQIKDVTVIDKVITGVGTAKTLEEAQHHLLTWNQKPNADRAKTKKSIAQGTKRKGRKKQQTNQSDS